MLKKKIDATERLRVLSINATERLRILNIHKNTQNIVKLTLEIKIISLLNFSHWYYIFVQSWLLKLLTYLILVSNIRDLLNPRHKKIYKHNTKSGYKLVLTIQTLIINKIIIFH